VGLLQSLQQVQTMLATMYPNGSASPAPSDTAAIDSFQQILAALSPVGPTAGGILGSGSGLTLGSGSAPTVATNSGPTGADVVADAEKYLGVPYVLDGESTKGIDCSGLVQKTYKDLGITLPRTVHEQKLMGTAVPSLAQAQPGDLIVFKGGGHVAIYEGNNTVIHAPYPGRVVSNQKLWVGDSGIETIRRILPSSTAAPAAAPTAAPPTPTSAATQAAALAAVQAIIQADFGLLSSASSSNGSGATGGSATSSQLQSAISSMTAATGVGVSSASPSTATLSTDSAQQALALEQSMLAQEEL
jgi:cell wall-associated NlpC family hydrolase